MLTDSEVCAIFAENLKDLMARDKISQSELARRCGCGISTVHNWVMGINVPRTGMLSALTKIFDCSASDLMLKKISPTLSDEARREEVIRMLMDLTPEEVEDVLGYIAFRKAMRKDPSGDQE